MIWFNSNVGTFVMGWVVQMIAMLTLSGVFAGTAWQIRKSNPLCAFAAGTALLISVVAFCRQHLTTYKEPRAVQFVDGFPIRSRPV
jgi:hypothetical protein